MESKTAMHDEGYVYTSYGDEKYLKDAIVSALTLKKHDSTRPIALVCSTEHQNKLNDLHIDHPFSLIFLLKEEHQSIVGFKHHLHEYMPFKKNLYLDSDMIWCRHPDTIWRLLGPFPYTITGQESADVFFGAHKNFNIVFDILLRRRQRTLKKFGLSYLARVQTGLMYAADYEVTKEVNELAAGYLQKKQETHFISRKKEKGRNLESCEWSLGMAVSRKNLYLFPWFNGQESFQLDFIDSLTQYNDDFSNVKCKFYCNPFMHSLRGIKTNVTRKLLFMLFSVLPRSQDHMWVTPYILHFGWKHQKKHFDDFVQKEWKRITNDVN